MRPSQATTLYVAPAEEPSAPGEFIFFAMKLTILQRIALVLLTVGDLFYTLIDMIPMVGSLLTTFFPVEPMHQYFHTKWRLDSARFEGRQIAFDISFFDYFKKWWQHKLKNWLYCGWYMGMCGSGKRTWKRKQDFYISWKDERGLSPRMPGELAKEQTDFFYFRMNDTFCAKLGDALSVFFTCGLMAPCVDQKVSNRFLQQFRVGGRGLTLDYPPVAMMDEYYRITCLGRCIPFGSLCFPLHKFKDSHLRWMTPEEQQFADAAMLQTSKTFKRAPTMASPKASQQPMMMMVQQQPAMMVQQQPAMM
eukprot:9487318-Pyramimonas_sp.AAC.1